MKIRHFALLLSIAALAGCVSAEDQRADAIAKARAHCESEGKQFLLGSVEQSGDAIFSSLDTTVSGQCLGPGDPGYVPPKADQPDKPIPTH
jgi:hypothetical protein